MEAVSLLPADDDPLPLQRLIIQLAWAEAMLMLSELDSAQDWLDRASQTIDNYDLWQLKPEAERLLQQL